MSSTPKYWEEGTNSPMTPTFGGEKHWLQVVESSNDFARSYFLKEQSELKNVMLGLTKDLFASYGISVKFTRCDYVKENEDFGREC